MTSGAILLKDREEAGHLLTGRLMKFKGQNPLILGIPRGAMPMAKVIAEGLNGELSAIFVHKIPAPGNEEFAIGSIGLSGRIHKTPMAKFVDASETYIQMEAKNQLQKLKERYDRYQLTAPDYRNRVVIIVDDGIATGATVIAAIHEVKFHHPKSVVVAAAVAARESARQIRKLVDELIVLDEPEVFYAVGQFFQDFSQVSDEEVISLLSRKQELQDFPSP